MSNKKKDLSATELENIINKSVDETTELIPVKHQEEVKKILKDATLYLNLHIENRVDQFKEDILPHIVVTPGLMGQPIMAKTIADIYCEELKKNLNTLNDHLDKISNGAIKVLYTEALRDLLVYAKDAQIQMQV